MSCMEPHEARLLVFVNQLRAGHGRLPLKPSLALMQAAQAHADEMADHNYMGHTGRNGSNAGDRIQHAGYPARSGWGENVAGGYEDADRTYLQWRDSPGHLANMLHPNFTEMGIARARGSRWGWVWCQVFGGADTPWARECGADDVPVTPPVMPPMVPAEPPPNQPPPRQRPPRLDGLAQRIINRVYRRLGLR